MQSWKGSWNKPWNMISSLLACKHVNVLAILILVVTRGRCCCCCSAAKSCPSVCDPRTATREASLCFTVSQSLLGFMSIELVKLSNHLTLCRPLSFCFQSFPESGSFLMIWLFASSGQNIGASASASASVLPMNIQGWYWKAVAEPWKTPGFLASGGQEFNLGPVTRLDRSELLCNEVLLKYKETEKASDIDIRRGQKECPLLAFSNMLYTYQQAVD